ncbi:dioxygenase [Streptomyces hygroscopicus subsp. jinggangensis 5008]|nr:dioxygenase [Streptomyces hygroscopicus subsp. jinggangensis 5008]AGF61649.1 dioxygenase [Streptomyces hygroscopicus subsp. jinggangensis TL01]
MQTELSGKLGIEHAVFGFTPFPAVAAAISRAGGFGVLGAVRYTAPDDLQRDLDWLDAHAGGRPYGLDVVMPANKAEGVTEADVEAMIPEEHRRFVRDTLAAHGVPEPAEGEASGWRITGWMEQVARTQLDVALYYPIRLLANALGSPPADVVERAHDRDILVAALAGSARHARKHLSTSWWPRATRPAATPGRSPPWPSRPRSWRPSTHCSSWRRAASAADHRWPPR